MRGTGKFTVGHCIKSIISLILPVGEPLKPFLLFYVLFETEAGLAVKRVYRSEYWAFPVEAVALWVNRKPNKEFDLQMTGSQEVLFWYERTIFLSNFS